MGKPNDLSAAWEANAGQWLAWSRTPELDVYHELLNLPAFAELVPDAGVRTLDLGCGEGRIGRWLAGLGHRVAGIDSSPTLADHAREAGGYEEVVCGDSTALPWSDDEFDLAVAFMSLHDMGDPAGAVNEVARVLAPGGVLCIAHIHPLNRATEHFDDYFRDWRFREVIARRGIEMTFEGVDRPLDSYTRPLFDNGFVIDELREPRASTAAVQRSSALAPAAKKPYFLHLRCRLSER
jgi:SAM-dependent methyltransferase